MAMIEPKLSDQVACVARLQNIFYLSKYSDTLGGAHLCCGCMPGSALLASSEFTIVGQSFKNAL